ncbi:hypothetical protein Aes508_086 [Aeromonas phage Aes508]|uniref:Uncharacterized protein n=1 Tax=Aeromonas phage Aes508 TaxID=1198013 RepID=J7KER8_9CAUD|nr:hypothetical protein F484_gp085 [Aeromonas phage Aes508]AFQ97168.1 hypothetical protein Aes508_086 [Aeromonas phage Aes508]
MIKRGFTLIELMVLVAIITILLSIAIPAFSDNEIYNPIDSACPNGLTTAITPSDEEILVCRKNQVINKQTLTIGE